MKTKSNPRKDFTQVAFAVMQQATGETEPEKELTGKKADSRKGGKAGGKARAEKLTPLESGMQSKK
ncbi:MAG: histone H1 [Candidatus Nitrotoga sp.]|nr:histone H1 [Candidatus Nitrotoga sp.]MDP1854447.1 histone H1 [Candidatus Nitrotoga sp.]